MVVSTDTEIWPLHYCFPNGQTLPSGHGPLSSSVANYQANEAFRAHRQSGNCYLVSIHKQQVQLADLERVLAEANHFS